MYSASCKSRPSVSTFFISAGLTEGLLAAAARSSRRVSSKASAEADPILRQSNWIDPTERRAAYAEQGRTRFGDTHDPYGPAKIEQERLRYRR